MAPSPATLRGVRTVFIINSRSGPARNVSRIGSTIRQWADSHGVDALIHTTGSLESLNILWQDPAIASAQRICAVGGDGTVLELGRRMAGGDQELAIIPTGSGNGLARHLGIPMNLQRALDLLPTAVPVRIDTGLSDSHRFLGTVGLGFDALVAHRFAEAGSRGLTTYVKVGATSYFDYSPQDYTIHVDGQTTRERALLVTVGNASQYGNEAKILPNASLTDGLLDVCVLRPSTVISAPKLIARLFSGTFDQCEEVCLLRGRNIVIERPAPGLAHADGDPFETGRRVEVRVDPRSLLVVVPASHADRI